MSRRAARSSACAEPIARDRLQQIVDRFLLEGGDGVLVVRRLEDDGRPRLPQVPRHVESADLRHRDVEQQDVGPQRRDMVQRLDGVGRLADALHVQLVEQAAQPRRAPPARRPR